MAVIGFSNTAYRTACRLAEQGIEVWFYLTQRELHQASPLPERCQLTVLPHLNPTDLPQELAECRAAVVASEDEQFNLHVMMALNSRYPHLRIVTRLFNLALGQDIEARFPRVTVLSVSDKAAPYFVASAYAEGVLSAWREDGQLKARVSRGDGQAGGEDTLVIRDPHEKIQVAKTASTGFSFKTDKLLLAVLGVLGLVILLGTLFFWRIHGLPPGDALYFVVTTLTTTGYGDYSLKDYPFSAKLAGMSLMLSGASLFAILFALLTDNLFRIRLEVLLGRRRVRKAGHVIVCGAGDVGIRLLECLKLAGADLVAIERNQSGRFNQRVRDLGLPLLLCDATLQDSLERAGIYTAQTIFCATDHDMSNLEVALNARRLNPHIRIVVRVFDRDFAEHIRDHFDLPVVLSSSAIASQAFADAALT